MRKTSELLQIMLDNINFLNTGLCAMCDYLHDHKERHITYYERVHLKKYIMDNWPDFTWNYLHFWRPGLKKPRIKWLKDHIKITQKSESIKKGS